MPQATIVSVIPKMVNGVQRQWTSQSGQTKQIYYSYLMSLSNGDNGEASSVRDGEYPLAVGTMITYNVSEGQYGKKFSNIKAVKNATSNDSGTSKSSYNDPEVTKNVALGICMQSSVEFFKIIQVTPRNINDIKHVANLVFFKWVMAGVPEDLPHYRDFVSRRYYAIRDAISLLEIPGVCPLLDEDGNKKTVKTILQSVLAMAEFLLKPFDPNDQF